MPGAHGRRSNSSSRRVSGKPKSSARGRPRRTRADMYRARENAKRAGDDSLTAYGRADEAGDAIGAALMERRAKAAYKDAARRSPRYTWI